ncbi:MAG: type II 3-dehydroquinate dehydratase [Deltaproteobacteria bacterium]|nr:type II 3-dehydroquinate dehydratase [Deltaproteobacteria bacterium]
MIKKKKLKILIIHGPNLNLLGGRETSVYGKTTLKEIDALLKKKGKELGVEVRSVQSNSEGELVEKIQSAGKKFDGVVMNPAAYTHTSVALRDAVGAVSIPVVEVHLSNIYQREDFRHHSFIAPVARGQICGFGVNSYLLGLEAVIKLVMA